MKVYAQPYKQLLYVGRRGYKKTYPGCGGENEIQRPLSLGLCSDYTCRKKKTGDGEAESHGAEDYWHQIGKIHFVQGVKIAVQRDPLPQ